MLDTDLVLTTDLSSGKVFQFAIPRSASSFIYQILRDVLGADTIFRSHSYFDTGLPVIASDRDLRDCAVSHWRFRYPRHVIKCNGIMSIDAIVYMAGAYNQSAWVWDLYMQRQHPVRLKYHEFIVKPSLIFDAIQEATGIAVSSEQQCQILASHSIENNRAVSNGEIPISPELFLDPGHVHEGQVGIWRKFVDDAGAELLTKLLTPGLTTLGYDL